MALNDALEVDSGSYTPESLKLRRRLAEAMLKAGMDTGPIGHWTQGANRMVQAMLGGMEVGNLERKEKEQQIAANNSLMGLLGPQAPAPAFASPTAIPDQVVAPANTPSASAVNVAPSGDMARYANAISNNESGGNYAEVGPVTRTGDRAYGKYQVMGNNVPEWTKQILGHEMTPQEFLRDPAAQEKVFQTKFGQYTQKYGPEGASKAWFAGEGGMHNPNAKDSLGTTVSAYAQKFNAGLGSSPAQAITSSTMPAPTAAKLTPGETIAPEVDPATRQRIGAFLSSPDAGVREMGRAMLMKLVTPKAPLTPLEQATLAEKQASAQKSNVETQKAVYETNLKATDTKLDDKYKLQDAISGIDRSFELTNDLIHHPGLPAIAGRGFGGEMNVRGTGVDLADLTPGTAQADAFNMHKTLISNVALRTMQDLKAASATGATGFGALSEKELQVLQDSIGNLRLSSTKDELTKNYHDFQKVLLDSRERLLEKFHGKYGDADPGVMSKQDLIDAATERTLGQAGNPVVRPKNFLGFDVPFTQTIDAPPPTPQREQQPQMASAITPQAPTAMPETEDERRLRLLQTLMQQGATQASVINGPDDYWRAILGQ